MVLYLILERWHFKHLSDDEAVAKMGPPVLCSFEGTANAGILHCVQDDNLKTSND